MFRGKSRRFTSAHAIAIAALFFALGGGAYAAVSSLPPNSVGTKQLQNGSVTEAKLAPGAHPKLTAKEKRELVKIIKKYTRKPGVGATGPAGPPGPKGETGVTGPSDVYMGGDAGIEFGLEPKEIASIVVPPGQYLIQAKASIFAGNLNTEVEVECRLAAAAALSATLWDKTELNLAPVGGTLTSAPIAMVGADSFSADQRIGLYCSSFVAEGISIDARVWATKVGTLHGLPVPTQ